MTWCIFDCVTHCTFDCMTWYTFDCMTWCVCIENTFGCMTWCIFDCVTRCTFDCMTRSTFECMTWCIVDCMTWCVCRTLRTHAHLTVCWNKWPSSWANSAWNILSFIGIVLFISSSCPTVWLCACGSCVVTVSDLCNVNTNNRTLSRMLSRCCENSQFKWLSTLRSQIKPNNLDLVCCRLHSPYR